MGAPKGNQSTYSRLLFCIIFLAVFLFFHLPQGPINPSSGTLQFGYLAKNKEKKSIRVFAKGIDIKDSEYQYTEKHKQTWDKKKMLSSHIEIFDKQNQLIVTRKINFSQHPYDPDFSLFDHRIGQEKTVRRLPSGKYEFSYLRKKDAKKSVKLATPKKKPIIYDGIYLFVKDHYRKILKEPVIISFADAKLQRFLNLRIEFQKEMLFREKAAYQFALIPTNSFFRLLVPSIEIVVAKSDGSLLMYTGPTNFNKTKRNKNFNTRIEYFH